MLSNPNEEFLFLFIPPPPEYIVPSCVALVCVVALVGGICIFWKRYMCVCEMLIGCPMLFQISPVSIFFTPGGPQPQSCHYRQNRFPWRRTRQYQYQTHPVSSFPALPPLNEGEFLAQRSLWRLSHDFRSEYLKFLWGSHPHGMVQLPAISNYATRRAYKQAGTHGRTGNLSPTA